MELIAKRAFPNATRVTDRFHVQKLATEALQEIRIKHRWEALDAENDAIELAKKKDRICPQSVLQWRYYQAVVSQKQVCPLQKRKRLDRKSETKSRFTIRILS